MKNTILPVVSILLLTIVRQASAETHLIGTNTVNVNTNGPSSNSHVCIETNGEKNCFDATGDQSVNWTSDDGNSSVKINNTNVQPIVNQSTKSETHTSVSVDQDDSHTEVKGTSSASSDTPTPTPKPKTDKSRAEFTFHLSDFFKSLLSFFGFSKR